FLSFVADKTLEKQKLHKSNLCKNRFGPVCAWAELAAVSALKLVAQPVIAYAAGLALHLSAPQLLAVVVCAGLPTAQNTFIFAQEYGVGEAVANRAVVVTTTLSLATLAVAATLLG
ncbi:AEC family transporter, partial [Micromonospora aurantiaca (nom. illeg.)]|uniref:AEC family transporter n=1 Tax=Micromonospora aurantiaca (nom. illeg.) TaxID=47850 RepID=UPI003808F513